MAPTCGICHQEESKYRCPTCDVRYCSLACYKPHKADHEARANPKQELDGPAQPMQDRPGTTQRIPKIDFTGFEDDKDFQRLLLRFPSLRLQLGTIYGLTLEPGPDDARTWNRQPLPGMIREQPSYQRGRGRGRGKGRGSRGARGGRSDHDWRDEREKGPWTREKGEKEALNVMKKMRLGSGGECDDAAEGMREFVSLCRIKYGEQGGPG